MSRPVTISKRTVMILALSLISLVVSSCASEPTQAPAARLRPVLVVTPETKPQTPSVTPDISATISAAFAAAKRPKSQISVIPADVAYSVIRVGIVSGIRKSIDVRLNKEVSETTLREIALELKSDDSRHYDRTFIVYYLPGMTVGGGGWATTHFDPALDVRILGLAGQEEPVDENGPTFSTREEIGRWLDDHTGSQIVMYRKGGKSYVEQYFNDGSVLKEELVETSSPLGRRLESKEGSSLGGHWVIDYSGNLEIRDNIGLISTAKRIR